jgi:hypothetical protein
LNSSTDPLDIIQVWSFLRNNKVREIVDIGFTLWSYKPKSESVSVKMLPRWSPIIPVDSRS